MAVTVVRGFVGKSEADGHSSRQAKTTATPATNSHNQSTLNSHSNEAVVSALRVSKVVQTGEKVRHVDEAEKLSEDVAERIGKKDGGSLDAHSQLSAHSARAHFA